MSKLTQVEEKVALIEGWAKDGLTQQQIADNLGIGLTTLKDYMKKSTSISTAIKKGKEVTDYQVENALFKSAINGNVTAMIFWLKNRRPDKWRDRRESAEIDLMQREMELKERKFELEQSKKTSDDHMTINVTIDDVVRSSLKSME